MSIQIKQTGEPIRTFQQMDRSPAVIWGSLCEDTAIFKSVKEWKSSS